MVNAVLKVVVLDTFFILGGLTVSEGLIIWVFCLWRDVGALKGLIKDGFRLESEIMAFEDHFWITAISQGFLKD